MRVLVVEDQLLCLVDLDEPAQDDGTICNRVVLVGLFSLVAVSVVFVVALAGSTVLIVGIDSALVCQVAELV